MFLESMNESNSPPFTIVSRYHLVLLSDDIKFTIRQMKIDQAFGLGAFADQDDIRITDITINGHVGNLIKHKNGMIELLWITNSYYLSIDGFISEEEIVKIAESMPGS